MGSGIELSQFLRIFLPTFIQPYYLEDALEKSVFVLILLLMFYYLYAVMCISRNNICLNKDAWPCNQLGYSRPSVAGTLQI